jgi:hypothetical protein
VKQLASLLARLHELETELADDYRTLGERHAADHDVYHQCHAFARAAEERAAKIAPHAQRLGASVDADDAAELWSGMLERARRASSALLGRQPRTGALLLRDLRRLLLAAEEVSIHWMLAGQGAQAARDAELLQVVNECHTEVETEVKWFTTRLKVAAPQALMA